MKQIVLKETQLHLLNENKAGKNMNLGKNYLMQQGNMSQDQALQIIGSIKRDMPNSRLADQKFILGICRMYLNGELSDGNIILQLNNMLKYVASDAHVNEYDNNLNNLSANDIIERFSTIRTNSISQEMDDLNNREYGETQNHYTIYRIETAQEAQQPQYSDYTDWCVTYSAEMYNNYTHNGEGIFYFCLRDGYEDVERIEGENCPLDEYGLSMIAVSVTEDGAPNTITCRWNHDNGGNDNIMTPEELSNIIGQSFYKAFPQRYTEEERKQRFQNDCQLLIDAYRWKNETDYYNPDYDEDSEDEIEDSEVFQYSPDGYYGTTYNVEIQNLPNDIIAISMQDEYEYEPKKTILFKDFRPLVDKIYEGFSYPLVWTMHKSSEYTNLVSLYKGDKYDIFNLQECQMKQKDLDGIDYRGVFVSVYNNGEPTTNILNYDGSLMLPQNVYSIGQGNPMLWDVIPIFLTRDTMNLFNFKTKQYVFNDVFKTCGVRYLPTENGGITYEFNGMCKTPVMKLNDGNIKLIYWEAGNPARKPQLLLTSGKGQNNITCIGCFNLDQIDLLMGKLNTITQQQIQENKQRLLEKLKYHYILNEYCTPDRLSTDDGLDFAYHDNNAFPFILVGNKLVYGTEGQWHSNMTAQVVAYLANTTPELVKCIQSEDYDYSVDDETGEEHYYDDNGEEIDWDTIEDIYYYLNDEDLNSYISFCGRVWVEVGDNYESYISLWLNTRPLADKDEDWDWMDMENGKPTTSMGTQDMQFDVKQANNDSSNMISHVPSSLSEYDIKLLAEVFKHFNCDLNNSFVAIGNTILPIMDLLQGKKQMIYTKDDEKKFQQANILHNEDPKTKWEHTQDFRNSRDEQLGKKLSTYDDNGNWKSEMPMAQYRSMMLRSEGKKNRKKKV